MGKNISGVYRAVAIGAALFFGSFMGSAEAVPLATGGSLTNGGVTWTLNPGNCLGAFCADREFVADGARGIRIQHMTAGTPLLDASSPDVADIGLIFDVTSSRPMRGASLGMGGPLTGFTGDGLAVVSETINTTGDLLLTYTYAGGTQLTDEVLFAAAQNSLNIAKDIFADASAGGTATIDFVTQAVAIPEPSGLGLLLVGLAGLLGRRRRTVRNGAG